MYCVHNGKCCVMVYNVERGEFVYIAERRWDKMTKEQKNRYSYSPLNNRRRCGDYPLAI